MCPRSSQTFPPRLEAARQRFEHWRSQCKRRTRIPEALWQVGTELAGEFGVHRTAKTLRLNYDALKARVSLERADSSSRCSPATFVELFPGTSPAVGKCVVEFEDGRGARVRVHLEDPDATLLTTLASVLMRGRP